MRGAGRHRKCVRLEGNGFIRQGRCGDTTSSVLGSYVHGGWWSGGDFLVMTVKFRDSQESQRFVPSSKILSSFLSNLY